VNFFKNNLDYHGSDKIALIKNFFKGISDNGPIGKYLIRGLSVAVVVYFGFIFSEISNSVYPNSSDSSSSRNTPTAGTKYYCETSDSKVEFRIKSSDSWTAHIIDNYNLGSGINYDNESYTGGNIINGQLLSESSMFSYAYFKGNNLYLKKNNSKCVKIN
jgi:hypothetical protein